MGSSVSRAGLRAPSFPVAGFWWDVCFASCFFHNLCNWPQEWSSAVVCQWDGFLVLRFSGVLYAVALGACGLLGICVKAQGDEQVCSQEVKYCQPAPEVA